MSQVLPSFYIVRPRDKDYTIFPVHVTAVTQGPPTARLDPNDPTEKHNHLCKNAQKPESALQTKNKIKYMPRKLELLERQITN